MVQSILRVKFKILPIFRIICYSHISRFEFSVNILIAEMY